MKLNNIIIYLLLSTIIFWGYRNIISTESNFKLIQNQINNIRQQIDLDDTQIKREQMIWPIVKIRTATGTFGSGIIISKQFLIEENKFKYFILTVAHVAEDRFVPGDVIVDSVTGNNFIFPVEEDFEIYLFNKDGSFLKLINAQFVDVQKGDNIDGALISFISEESLDNIANLPDQKVLDSIGILSKVYAAGCPLKHDPMLTIGEIIQLYEKENEMMSSTNIAPGSSGGGLFIEYKRKYYLIGITNAIASSGFSLFTYLTYSIPIKNLREFLAKQEINF